MPQKIKEIKQLAEIYTMVERMEMSEHDFLLAFKSRFGKEITSARNKWREKNTGWDKLDWSRIEQDPLLSQLLTD